MCRGEDRGAEPPQARVQGSVPHTRQPGRTAKSLQMVKYRGGRVEAHACGLLTSALPFHRSVQGSTVLKTETERVGDELDSQPQVDGAAAGSRCCSGPAATVSLRSLATPRAVTHCLRTGSPPRLLALDTRCESATAEGRRILHLRRGRGEDAH